MGLVGLGRIASAWLVWAGFAGGFRLVEFPCHLRGRSVHAVEATLALRLMRHKGCSPGSFAARRTAACAPKALAAQSLRAARDARHDPLPLKEDDMKKAIENQVTRAALELRKLAAEVARIEAESEKFKAEARKIARERAYYLVTGISAIAVAIGALAQAFR